MPGSLALLAKRCNATGRPAQARYSAPPSPSAADKVSRLAWTIKTFVRPLGSASRMAMPPMGSGMALPFNRLGRIDLATGHLAEDQKLGADFALAGKAPRFCPDAEIVSRFPRARRASVSSAHQMGAWALSAIIGEFLFKQGHAISRRSLHLAAFTLDPHSPLALLAMSSC